MKEKSIKEIINELPDDFKEAIKSLVFDDETDEKAYEVYANYRERGYSHEEAKKMADLEMLK